MWQHNYVPLGGSLGLSAAVAGVPVFVMLFLLAVRKMPAWVAALSGLAAAAIVALFAYGMPVRAVLAATAFGAAFGIFPICWIVFWAIMLYRLTVETGNFQVLKDSIGGFVQDSRLQALLVGFGFGAFLEGASGFGAPVAIAAAMLAGLGFPRFYAAGICLLANTAPVAFGSIGIPILTLAGVTGLPVRELSAWAGRICAPMSLIIPAYLVLVMGGWKGLLGVWPAVLLCGVTYSVTQLLTSNFLGPQLTDIPSALIAIGSLMILFKFWKPRDSWQFADGARQEARASAQSFLPEDFGENTATPATHPGASGMLAAWTPYLLLVVLVFLWGHDGVKQPLERLTFKFAWPGLHNTILRVPPVVSKPVPYEATFTLNYLSASGTACAIAVLLNAALFRVSPVQFGRAMQTTARQLALPVLTIAAVLALAFLMNYCGATTTLGLAFAATGRLFSFFSPLLGWAGVFLVGSDTSANALFGNLQVVTAGRLGLDPVLMAASNSSGGVMGKMISLSSIAVAAAATGLPPSDETRLFRFTLKHSVILASLVGLIVATYAFFFSP